MEFFSFCAQRNAYITCLHYIYLTLEEDLESVFDKDSNKDDGNESDIIVIPPETIEVSGEEERYDILNNNNDIFPCDTDGEIEVCVKRKFLPSKNNKNDEKKTDDLEWK